ncbi:MAG: transcription antitermination factor NusB [Deltaproteobacteria bacterium]|nr:MAG: transcription antitermination factor NusB [Deltaproteobacteria bacterium]
MKRRRSREIALQILYQLEVNPLRPEEAVELYWKNFSPPEDLREFTERVVRGVVERKGEIDRMIAGASEHWRLERMDRVDRNILRMGVFEIVYCDDIPYKVAINEAIELGKRFGSEDSGGFINGILDRIAKTTMSEEVRGNGREGEQDLDGR